MQEFIRRFIQIGGKPAKILIEHYLFDNQVFYCDQLHIINDNHRLGVTIRNNEIFMDKQDIKISDCCDDTYTISDQKLTITIIVNNL